MAITTRFRILSRTALSGRLRGVRIGTRLALGFGSTLALMIVLVVGGTVYGLQSWAALAASIGEVGARDSAAEELKQLASDRGEGLRNLGTGFDLETLRSEAHPARQLAKDYATALEKLRRLPLDARERESVEMLVKIEADFAAALREALGEARGTAPDQVAAGFLGRAEPSLRQASVEIDRLVDFQKGAYRDVVQAMVERNRRAGVAVIAVEILVILLAILVALTVTRSITSPLRDSVGVARRVAAGDLTASVEARGRDEAAELLQALRQMNASLGGIVRDIRTGADAIAGGAGEVAAGNESLSSRTEEQATSLEQTAATLEEFASTVKQNADNARRGDELAAGAAELAARGGKDVDALVARMGDLAASSKRITDIAGTIDAISFQTNILALNAAVEAARAGDQGRGFAVVAAEVRALSQRSAQSSKEIRGLIEASVSDIGASASLVRKAGATMGELVAAVREVSAIMAEIAGSSRAQSQGVEQIHQAVAQMDTAVQMNASLVSQTSAAANAMADRASGLVAAVARFRVEPEELLLAPALPG